MAKKRDHKKVLNKRKQCQLKKERNAQLEIEKALFNNYAEGQKILPMPTLDEALASQLLEKDERINDAILKMMDYFGSDLEEIVKKQEGVKCYLPDNAISFIIPLDFYIPLPSPYNAVAVKAVEGEINYATCVSVVSKIIPVGESAIKVSYLISTICNNGASSASKKESPRELLRVYEEAILTCNNVIASFQSIPSRHNHYFHPITVQSAPSRICYFSFNKTTKRILKRGVLNIHGNVYGEILQCHPLDERELACFRNSHLNKSFSDDKIFYLINKMNEAVNSRCFGRNNEAIILADNFVELSLGYLLCEIKIANGEKRKDVHEQYVNIKTMNEIWSMFASLLRYDSIKKLKKDIGFDEWMHNCRNKRDDLTHRFLTGSYTGKESLDAINSSGELIYKLCIIIDGKIKNKSYPISDKMNLLCSSTLFIKGMHDNDEAERNGKKYPSNKFMI